MDSYDGQRYRLGDSVNTTYLSVSDDGEAFSYSHTNSKLVYVHDNIKRTFYFADVTGKTRHVRVEADCTVTAINLCKMGTPGYGGQYC